MPLPILIEGPAPDRERLVSIARELERYDWVICSSTRAVRALSSARGAAFPAAVRTAAVGPSTADALVRAGAVAPVVADVYNAEALWQHLRSVDAWHQRRVVVATVAGGRRELIDGLRRAGAEVTELEAYTMVPRSADAIRADWAAANPDALIAGSAAAAQHLIEAIGVDAIQELKAVVPIGPTTAAALRAAGIGATPAARATFASAYERLAALARAAQEGKTKLGNDHASEVG
jgi:uroporphyrinogen-III synthase